MSPDPAYSLRMRLRPIRLLSAVLISLLACSDRPEPAPIPPSQGLDLGFADAQVAEVTDAGVSSEDTGVVSLDGGEPDAQPTDGLVPDPTRFVPAGELATARSSHSATLLADGRVWVVGGFGRSGRPLASTELYDPHTNQWSPGPTLDEPRANHIALRLNSGQVIIAGGGLDNNIGAPAGRGILASALRFDPTDGRLVPTASLAVGRSHATATLLEDGRVLVSGGSSDVRTTQPAFGDALGSTELYDPIADRWSPGPALGTPRYLHNALRLSSGEVAIIGGSDQSEAELLQIELLHPGTGSRRDGPNLSVGRVFQAASQLASGRGLIVCGKQANIRFLNTGELLAADGAELSPSPPLPGDSRTAPTLSLLPSGRALLVGGLHGSPAGFYALADAFLYDESASTWTSIEPLTEPRVLHSATVLNDGSVLICGGQGDADTLASCERSTP